MAAKPPLALAEQHTKISTAVRNSLALQPLADISNAAFRRDDGDDWTPQEELRLQTAMLRGIHPTKPRFWQEVAKQVGRRPSECAQKAYGALAQRSLKALPKAAQALTRRVQAQQQKGLRVSTTRRGGPRATEASTRRKMRADSMWVQLKGLQLADSVPAEAAGDHSEVAEAIEQLQRQQRAHQYTSSILNRRGGWIKYQREVTDAGKKEPCPAGGDAVLPQPGQQPKAAAVPAAVVPAAIDDEDGAETAATITTALEQLHAERLRQQVDSEDESDEYFDTSGEDE